MAESTIPGDFKGGINITCILDEGAPTIAARVFAKTGSYDAGFTLASEISVDSIVSLSSETDCTYAATQGLPVVERVTTTDQKVIGVVISEPRWVKIPVTTGGCDTLAKRLAGKWYRIATVEIWGGITKITSAKFTSAGTAAVVPGVPGTVTLDVSETLATGRLCLTDVANSGTGFVPLTYVASSGGVITSILVGINDLGTALT